MCGTVEGRRRRVRAKRRVGRLATGEQWPICGGLEDSHDGPEVWPHLDQGPGTVLEGIGVR